jgi:hypothetical protein
LHIFCDTFYVRFLSMSQHDDWIFLLKFLTAKTSLIFCIFWFV